MKTVRDFLDQLIKAIKHGALVGVESTLTFGAELISKNPVKLGYVIHNTWLFECYGPDGNLKWVEEVPNIVVDVGLDDILEQYFKGSAYTASHFVGLVDAASFSAFAPGDTMASHAGWLTGTPYSNATDPSFTPGSVSGQSVDNSASKAVFNINATLTVKGAFLKDNNTKGGATGLLVGAAAFASDRAVASGDTLNVTVTATQATA